MSKELPHAQIHQNVASFYYDVVLYTPIRPGEVEVNLGDKTKVIKTDGAYEPLYTFKAKEEELRALYERLREHFRVGKDETYVDGKLEATEQHLKDMRDLVFNHHVSPQYETKSGTILGANLHRANSENDLKAEEALRNEERN